MCLVKGRLKDWEKEGIKNFFYSTSSSDLLYHNIYNLFLTVMETSKYAKYFHFEQSTVFEL